MGLEEVKPAFNRDLLRRVIREADAWLSERDKVREEAIRIARDVNRYSGWAVTAVHKGDFDEALSHLSKASEAAKRLLELVSPYPELANAGFAASALAEYAEASIFVGVVLGRGLPTPEDLGVGYVAYLQGLGDAVGEFRRLALEFARRGEIEVAWRLLEAMEAIYLELRALDYPEALAPGIRHKADVARRLVDDTKALLIDVEYVSRLQAALREAEKRGSAEKT
ncbi:MAG: haloacid dehalogenase [Desulfurococcales archaeon]|nr:haloacid dehalogenase [Desulfurococcales archaeon]